MYIIPVVVDESGCLMASEPIPPEATHTIITPEGCKVFIPEDSE